MHNSPIIVVDLDGTLVRVNTFHRWMRFSLLLALKKGRFLTAAKMAFTVALRLFKRISHARMKYLFLTFSEPLAEPRDIERFVRSLDAYIHPAIRQTVAQTRAFTLLATAAPALYAVPLAKRYGFQHCIATPGTATSPWYETLRERKAEAFEAWCSARGIPCRIDRLYTDHYDDLPLMKRARTTVLVNPSSTTLQKVQEEGIRFETELDNADTPSC